MLEAIEVDSQLAKLEWRFARDALGGDPGTGALVLVGLIIFVLTLDQIAHY